MRPNLSLRAMRYVQMAMASGSIAAAAKDLNVATSAIAAALDQAEAAFGLPLVTRVRAKGISPTSAGRVILRRIEDLLDRFDTMMIDGAELRTSLSGVLKIGYYAPVAPAFLPRILAPILVENPGLGVSLEECDNARAQSGLLDGSFDAILFVDDAPAPLITVDRLIEAPGYCLVAGRHRFAQRSSVSLEDLTGEPIILLDRPVAKSYYLDLLERANDSFSIVATANSTEMVRALVGTGIGCAILNMRPATGRTYAGDDTICIPISDSSAGLTLALGHVPGPRRRVVQVFADACRSHFHSSEGKALVVSPAGMPDLRDRLV